MTPYPLHAFATTAPCPHLRATHDLISAKSGVAKASRRSYDATTSDVGRSRVTDRPRRRATARRTLPYIFGSSFVLSSGANRRGIAAIVCGMAAFSISDVFTKLVALTHPLGEVFAVRGLFAVVLVGAAMVLTGDWRCWRFGARHARACAFAAGCRLVGALRCCARDIYR